MRKTLKIKDALSTGWKAVLQRPRLWALLAGFFFVVQVVRQLAFEWSGLTQENIEIVRQQLMQSDAALESITDLFRLSGAELAPFFSLPWLVVALVLAWPVELLLSMGWAAVSLKCAYGEPVTWRDYFKPMANGRRFLSFVAAALLFAGLLFLALAMTLAAIFLFPSLFYLWLVLSVGLSVVVSTKFGLWPYLLTRLELGPIDALRAASQVSNSAKPALFVLLAILGLLTTVLSLIPYVGWFLSMTILKVWSWLTLAGATRTLLAQTTLSADLHPHGPDSHA